MILGITKKDTKCTCTGTCESCPCAQTQRGGGIPLASAKTGERGRITRISGADTMRRHLLELGLTEGENICAICETNGNMIIEIRGSRIAIDSGLARRISFSPEV